MGTLPWISTYTSAALTLSLVMDMSLELPPKGFLTRCLGKTTMNLVKEKGLECRDCQVDFRLRWIIAHDNDNTQPDLLIQHSMDPI